MDDSVSTIQILTWLEIFPEMRMTPPGRPTALIVTCICSNVKGVCLVSMTRALMTQRAHREVYSHVTW